MASLLVVAHAPLASALRAVAAHVYPEAVGHVAALDVGPASGVDEVAAELRRQLDRLGDPEVLILADVFGATPCNAALKLADGERVRVVAGVNVPMLWRTLCYVGEPLEDLAARAVSGGQHGAMLVATPRRQNQPNHPAAHDQVGHHDQQ